MHDEVNCRESIDPTHTNSIPYQPPRERQRAPLNPPPFLCMRVWMGADASMRIRYSHAFMLRIRLRITLFYIEIKNNKHF